MLEREITRRELLELGRLVVVSGGVYAVFALFDSFQTSSPQVAWPEKNLIDQVPSWARNKKLTDNSTEYILAALAVAGEPELFVAEKKGEALVPIYKVRAGIDFGNAVYGLQRVDEKGNPIGETEKLTIFIAQNQSIDDKGKIVMIEDKVYPIQIPQGMRARESLNAIFDYTSGLSTIIDVSNDKVVAVYDPLKGSFLLGGPEDIFEKAP